MAQSNSQPVIKLLPSLADFAFLLPVVFLFTRLHGTKALLGDGDTGWHIRTGEWILTNGRVPHLDIFSFTRPGQPWFAWEWLWDVLFALAFRSGGLALVVLLNIILIGAIFWLLFRVVSTYATPLVALPVTIFAVIASSIHWLARPHLFTLLFTIIFFRLIDRAAEGETKWFYWMPAITVLWTNLHGGFFVGVILLLAYAAGEVIRAVLTSEADVRSGAIAKAVRFGLTAAACMAASLVNPYFYKLHVHVFEYLADPYQNDHIVEFLSPNFHHPMGPFFEALLVGGAIAAVWYARRGDYRAPVILALWFHGSLLAQRNVPLFAILAAPFVAGMLDAGLRRLPELPVAGWIRKAAAATVEAAGNIAEMEQVSRWHVVSLATIALVAAVLYAPAPPFAFRSQYDPAVYPAKAVEKLKFTENSRIFANDEWGDFLIFSLYNRGTKVFVDGRSDFYGRDFEEKYLDAYAVKFGWEKTLEQYGIDTVLLPVNACLTGALKESSRWRVIYDDGQTLAFQPVRAAGAGGTTSASTGGSGRDREITKTQARDRSITLKSKT